MRLYKAASLKSYIEQLKRDIVVLEQIQEDFENGIYANPYSEEIRDTLENHNEIMSTHRDTLRRARNGIL